MPARRKSTETNTSIWQHEDRLFMTYFQSNLIRNYNNEYKYDLLIVDKDAQPVFQAHNDYLSRAQRSFGDPRLQPPLFVLNADPNLPKGLARKTKIIPLIPFLEKITDCQSSQKFIFAREAYLHFADRFDLDYEHLQITSPIGYYLDKNRFQSMSDIYLDLDARYLIKIYELVYANLEIE